jgi:hypothetical protein
MFGLILSCHLHVIFFLVCVFRIDLCVCMCVGVFFSILLVLFSFTRSKSKAFLCLFMSFFNQIKVDFQLVHYVHTK